MKTVLVAIDMQNDFCSPQGALYVPNAEADVANLAAFIEANLHQIDGVVLTLDTHHVVDISHPSFWMDMNGCFPPPYTTISLEDVLEGRWIPRYEAEKAVEYLRKLKEQEEFPHIIWPEHCLIGSEGASIARPLMEVLAVWARTGRYYSAYSKGSNPFTEHFGALKANVPIDDAPETQLNLTLIEELRQYDRIVVAGEAKSHCVASTIKQLCQFPDLIEKAVLLNDCSSNVPNFEKIADPIYRAAEKLGMKSVSSKMLTL